MKQEERLFDLLGRLPEELLAQAEPPRKRRRWLAPAAAAACLCLAAGLAFWSLKLGAPSDTADIPQVTPGLSGVTAIQTTAPAIPEKRVEVSDILYNGKQAYVELALKFSIVEAAGHSAEYHLVTSKGPQLLADSLGSPLETDRTWYRLSGHQELQYLIHQEEDGGYSLWEFAYFTEESYPYSDVLERIYGITGPEDLLSITVEPANMDNTDAGQALQKEIGTINITDRAGLELFYQAITAMTCLGPNHWELIERGDQGDWEGGLLYAVQTGRYLTVETADGVVFDTLKYSAAGGQFYEYSGVAYDPLPEDVAGKLNTLFHIDVT